jgi:CHAT domain-containing protein
MRRLLRIPSRLLLLTLAVGLAFGVSRTRGGAAARGDERQLVEVESLTSVEARGQAAADLTADAARLRQAGDLASLARTLDRLAEIYLKLNDSASALSAAREALDLSRRLGDAPLLVDTLNVSGVVYRSRTDNAAALRLLNEAHELSLGLNYRRGEAQSLTELGTTHFNQSELDKAVACGEGALHVWRELQDRRGEAHTLYNLGAPYMRQGKMAEAADALESAAALWRELGNPTEQANALLDLNFLAIREGQWGKALTLLNQIQPLVTDKEAEPFMSGQVATSFGEVYEAYGQLEAARGYFSEALTLYRDYAHDVASAIDASSKAGRVQARLGDYEGAAQQIEEGLRLAEQFDNKFMTALCREDLGRVHLSAGLNARAKQELIQAVSGYERTGNRREWARAQAFLAQTDYAQGDWAAASKSYNNSLRVFQDIEDYTNEAAVCFGLGKLELEQQNFEEAGKHLKRSIDLTEQLRENAAGKDLRSSFLASVHDRYDAYVELLMQRHSVRPGERLDIAAFEASELGRARSLIDSLRDHQRELRHAADPSFLIEEETLQKREQKLLDTRAKLESEGGAGEEVEKVEDELTKARARYETLEAQINSTAKYNNLLRPQPLTFEEIRSQITDSETSLLEFSLGDRKSYLWLVTPDGLTSYELPDKQTIEVAALRLANLLTAPRDMPDQEAEVREAIAEVSRLVLSPVAGKLRSRRLIVVSDGILQYIPFQILADASDAGEPLIARHEIVNVPSASTLVLARRETAGRPAAPKMLAALGDPVFSSSYSFVAEAKKQERAGTARPADEDPRRALVSDTADTFDPNRIQSLFFAKQELDVLRELVPADEALVYSDFDATRDRLREIDLRQYRILHFATHGLLNAKQPELSGLMLSLVDQEGRPVSGFVGLSDIYNLRAPVDLVVLSACRTALGKDVRGEGLVGITRGFMYAGASGVVASLWRVDDEATAELMKRFYSNMLQQGMPPAAALREAQNSIRQEPQWRSPYYWAAFTLQGEYRQVIKSPTGAPASVRTKVVVSGVLFALLSGAAWWYLRRRGWLPARVAKAIRH